MKKLIALLLALMMPLCAAAEAYSFSLSVSTDEALFPWYMNELLTASGIVTDEDDELSIRMMQALLNGLTFDVQIQDELLTFACSVNGSPLFDLNIGTYEHKSFMTSSLFSGYAFVSEDAATTSANVLQTMMAQTAWNQIAADAQNTAAAWFGQYTPDIASGSFSGDAYDGAAVCKTWVLSDSDIANLVSLLMTDDMRNLIAAFGRELEIGNLLEQFDTLNAQVAEKDSHLYILRVAESEQDKFCGMSLTILRDMQQIATASIGTTEKGFKFVVGMGLSEENYWWEFTAKRRQRNNMTTLSGTSREWLSDKEMNFSYVSAKVAPVSNYDWHCYLTKSGKRYLWDASIYQDIDQIGYNYLMSSDGKVNSATGDLDFTVALGDSPYVPASVRVKLTSVAPKTLSIDGLEQIVVSSDFDIQQYDELTQQATALLTARLLKILPADLFLKILEMNIMD